MPSPRRVSVALVVNHRPVGMLVLQDVQLVEHDASLLGTFANQAALAVDRAQLSEQALRARLLEEIDRWRRALMGAASHDLRTPLASIKTAVSSLRQVDAHLSPEDRAELLEFIELQSDRLARLVTNLLDMTRLEAGVARAPADDRRLQRPGRRSAGPAGRIVAPGRVTVDAPAGLPLLHLDHVLMSQVLANVLENAERLSPHDSMIRVTARRAPGRRATGRDRRGRRRSRHCAGGPRERLRDVQPERRRRPGRARPGHRQGLRRGARRADLDRPRRGPRRPDRLHRPRGDAWSRRRSEGPP